MKLRLVLGTVLVLGLLAVLTFLTLKKAEEKVVTIAIQPTEQSDEIMAKVQELKSFLEERVDAKIEISVPTSYNVVVEGLRFNHVQVAFMGGLPAYHAHKVANAEIVLSELREVIIDEEPTIAPFYYSYYVVLKDSPYNSLEELKGKKVAYTSQTSTSGYLFPWAKLIELGFISENEEPNKFFGEVYFAGGYAQAWEALKRGQVDVSVIAGDVPTSLYYEVLENTKTLEKQGPVPSHVVVFNKNLDKSLKTQLKKAFLELNDPKYRDLMRNLISAIFVEFKETTFEEHLGPLMDVMKLTGYEYGG